MSTVGQPPGTPQPEGQGVLLAAFHASLTKQGLPLTKVPPSIGIILTLGADDAVPTSVPNSSQADNISPARRVTPVDEASPVDEAAADWVPPPAGEFVPPEGWWCSAQAPDPDTDRPPELAGLSEEELQPLTTPPVLVPAAWPEGIVPPDGFPTPVPPTLGGPGFGFGQGDLLDLMPPGVTLAGLAEDAHSGLAEHMHSELAGDTHGGLAGDTHGGLGQDAQAGLAGDVQGGLGGIDSDCLVGVIRAWRRITSWATGRELAAVAELARRYPADGLPGSGCEYVADELSAALTLTGRAAQDERDLAAELATRLPATLAALSAGRIDLARARVLANGTAELAPAHAAAVEAAVLPTAPGLTTGQLRAAVAKAVLAAGPGAADRQRDAAQARAHVACWTGQSGTAHLEGHDLPPAQTLAADARLGQIATRWKAQGAQGGMDLLRAHAYLALLLGHDTAAPPASLMSPDHTPTTTASGPGPTHPADSSNGAGNGDRTPSSQIPAGLRPPAPEPGYGLPPVAAMINLTIPLATLLHLSDSPGEAAGYGPIAAATAQALADAAAGHLGTRWQLTVTSPDRRALATGASRGRAVPAEGWTVTVTPITTGDCDHRSQEPGYRPSPALARLIRTRTTTCCFPGCRRPARKCDLDHVIPYDDGGRTCQCDLAPLCRRHHRAKQAEGWTLSQPTPGVLVWLTPAGRRYTTLPSQHPT